MAALKARGKILAVLSGNKIKIHDFSKDTGYTFHLPETPNINTEKSTENPSKNAANVDKNVENDTKNEKTKISNRSEKENSSEVGGFSPNRTLSSAFSDSGLLFAVSDDRKQVHLYRKTESDDISTFWILLSSRSVVRRSTCVLFTRDEKYIILGDKSGDVYKFSVADPTEPGQLMMGHLSVLLDMVLVDNDRYLVTCDRDEKIRVSLFPNTYNIHCYCLGHTDFITRLVYVPEDKVIISGGGDGTIRSWDLQGKNLHCLEHGVIRSAERNKETDSNSNPSFSNNNNNFASVKCMVFDPHNKTVAVSFEQSKLLQLYKINIHSGISLCDQRQLLSEPWDIHFLTDSRLLVLLPLQENTVLLFDCSNSSNEESSVGLKISEYPQKEPKIQEFLKSVNTDWAFFEPSVNIGSLISSSLPRNRFDVSDYLERKERQIKKKFQPKGKRTKTQASRKSQEALQEEEPSTKAVKVDMNN